MADKQVSLTIIVTNNTQSLGDSDPFDDAEAPAPATFVASFPGSCTGCGEFIDEGDIIAMTDDGAICEECVINSIDRPRVHKHIGF